MLAPGMYVHMIPGCQYQDTEGADPGSLHVMGGSGPYPLILVN